MLNLLAIKASDVPVGRFFRKKTGTTAYLRISDSSVNFLKLPPDSIYGVARNGNIAQVMKDKAVCLASIKEFWNRDDQVVL